MSLLLIYLSVLLLGIVLYTTFKKTAGKKELYLKFFSFALVALCTYAFLDKQSGHASILYAVIGTLGLYEIIRASGRIKNAFVYIAIALVMFSLFVSTAFITGFPHSNLFLCVLSFDAFSQFFGQLFGKQALLKKISPNKTIEGSTGGLLICILTSFCTFGSVWKGCYIAFFALAGDLLASFVKRKAGIKDFSRLLPGQGGVLDRFDSYILVSICYLPVL